METEHHYDEDGIHFVAACPKCREDLAALAEQDSGHDVAGASRHAETSRS